MGFRVGKIRWCSAIFTVTADKPRFDLTLDKSQHKPAEYRIHSYFTPWKTPQCALVPSSTLSPCISRRPGCILKLQNRIYPRKIREEAAKKPRNSFGEKYFF
ncbi:hypothetical protein TWF694_002947 [Orbilia ellipsospora]|uniref:Uncharacterized protein n=1 Tax=Orbilia ellipsospora TaxID=2528407 RepID=A0AAV9X074_9PEZI